DRALVLLNLGLMLQADGRLDEARGLVREALAIRQKALPPDHPEQARCLNILGVLSAQQGRTAEAWRHLRDATAVQAASPARFAAASTQAEHAAAFARDDLRRDLYRYHLDLFLGLAGQSAPLTAEQSREVLAALLGGKAVGTAALAQRQLDLLELRGPDAALYQQLKARRQELAD